MGRKVCEGHGELVLSGGIFDFGFLDLLLEAVPLFHRLVMVLYNPGRPLSSFVTRVAFTGDFSLVLSLQSFEELRVIAHKLEGDGMRRHDSLEHLLQLFTLLLFRGRLGVLLPGPHEFAGAINPGLLDFGWKALEGKASSANEAVHTTEFPLVVESLHKDVEPIDVGIGGKLLELGNFFFKGEGNARFSW
jgi:hypothetical protein